MTPKVSDIHTLVGVGLSGLISTLLGQAAWTMLGIWEDREGWDRAHQGEGADGLPLTSSWAGMGRPAVGLG